MASEVEGSADEAADLAQPSHPPLDGRWEISRISNGPLGSLDLLRDSSGRELVLRTHPVDLGERFRRDADVRFRSTLACLPVSPFVKPTAPALQAAGEMLDIETPRILTEGRCADGSWYTLSTRLEGHPWQPHMERDAALLARISFQLGAVARQLHAHDHPVAHAVAGLDEASVGEIMECLGDHLPYTATADPATWKKLAAHFEARRESRMVLTHGDLGPANVLLDDKGDVRGLVDYELSMWGVAEADFRWLERLDEREFIRGYGVDARDWERSRWLGAFFELLWDLMYQVIVSRFLRLPVPLPRAQSWEEHTRRRLRALAALR